MEILQYEIYTYNFIHFDAMYHFTGFMERKSAKLIVFFLRNPQF